jgi:dolichyldiphosphatase
LLSRILVPIIVLPWAALIALSRIWLGHHTWPQVAVGCAYGVGFACIWFALWTQGLNELGRTAEELVEAFLDQM